MVRTALLLTVFLIVPLFYSTAAQAQSTDDAFVIDENIGENHPCARAGATGVWRGWCMFFGDLRVQSPTRNDLGRVREAYGVWGPAERGNDECLSFMDAVDRRSCFRQQRGYLYGNVRAGVVAPRVRTREWLRKSNTYY